MTELKPCPFCGGEVRLVRCITYQDGFYWAIEGALGDNGCECNVTMESQLFDDEHGEFEKKQLMEAWNQRTPDIDKVVEKLEWYLTGWVPIETIYKAIEIVKGGEE